MKTLKTTLLAASIISFGLSQNSFAQENLEKENLEKENQIAIIFGTIQPFALSGWNAEIDYFTDNLVFEYSHGWSLELRGETVVGEAKEQGLSIHIPFSTGFGVGYRITENFNARLEGKVHRFQAYYENETFDKNNLIGDYTTTTLGIGVYYTYKPFKKQSNFLKGIFTSTSLRYWHKVSSTLKNDELSYFNTTTNKNEIHKASEIGIANTPWIFNISIGYSFKTK